MKAEQLGWRAPPRRFYKDVSLGPSQSIMLDRRPLRTPRKALLTLPTLPLAQAVADEWDAQGEAIDPAAMPLTRLANTAIDRVHGDEARIIEEIASYAGSDLVCYRAREPEDLVARQARAWDPVLAWASAKLDAPLAATRGIVHHPQASWALAAVRRRLQGESIWPLVAIRNMTTLTGSALIAMKAAGGDLAPEQAWQAAHVDEDWQIEQWGEDAEATARRKFHRAEFDACLRFLDLSQP